ncbi:MAG: sulfatase, partial [bacterium]
VDTLRRDHLPIYGYPRDTAPALRRLAADGATLNALSPTSWTSSATATLLTGLHPVRHRLLGEGDALPPNAVTLAERLRAAGYATLAVSSNPHVSAAYGLDQGFDEFVPAWNTHSPWSSDAVNRELRARLGRLRKPYFLYVHYTDPHQPYNPPFAWDGGPLGPGPRQISTTELQPSHVTQRDPRLMRRAIDLYDGEIRACDTSLGELLGWLHEAGVLQDAVTVVTADHGEEFEDHGRLDHGQSLHAEVVEVPLVVHAPRRVHPGHRPETVGLVDVVPTILGLLGAEPLSTDGLDLSPALEGGAALPAGRDFLLDLDLRGAVSLALQQGPQKLVLARNPWRRTVYDLLRDPKEAHGVELAQAPAGAALARRLADMHNALVSAALPAQPVSGADTEALRALGYVGSGPGQRQTLPRLVRPADASRVDSLGWEVTANEQSCLDTTAATAEAQLLDGWFPPELGGRWTAPSALLRLGAVTKGPATLVLRGVNHETQPYSFSVTFDGLAVASPRVGPGPFRLTLPVTASAEGSAVRLRREAAFVPAKQGLPDDRTLGIFLTAICLTPR